MKSFEQFNSNLCEEVDLKKLTTDRMAELTSYFYKVGCNRERRIDGYAFFIESSRKFRLRKTSDEKDFYIEVVNKGDESFVADIGNTNRSFDEIVKELQEF